MNLFVISYELRRHGHNYQPFHAALRACGTALRPLDATSIVGTEMPAAAVRDALMPHLGAADRLLVVTCASNAAQYELASTGASGEHESRVISAKPL